MFLFETNFFKSFHKPKSIIKIWHDLNFQKSAAHTSTHLKHPVAPPTHHHSKSRQHSYPQPSRRAKPSPTPSLPAFHTKQQSPGVTFPRACPYFHSDFAKRHHFNAPSKILSNHIRTNFFTKFLADIGKKPLCLRDTCLTAQDNFKSLLNYFRIKH